MDDAALKRLAQEVVALGVVRVKSESLWRIYGALSRAHGTPHEERTAFLAAMRALESRGVIRLPPLRGTRWDRTSVPSIPHSIDVIVTRGERPAEDWRVFPWHPTLDWVRSLRAPTHDQVRFLRRIHDSLNAGAFSEIAPLKYRSLQLTGNEKGLRLISKTALFGKQRLSLGMLGCMPEVLPLAWESVGDSLRMLIFENAAAFYVARNVLTRMEAPPYGMVAYGAGRSVVGSVAHLLSIEPRPTELHYVGDLDAPGLSIARAAQVQAARLQLAPLLPATALHRTMLATASKLGEPDGWPDKKRGLTSSKIENATKFLDASLRPAVAAFLSKRKRIPEEVLGPVEMREAFEAAT